MIPVVSAHCKSIYTKHETWDSQTHTRLFKIHKGRIHCFLAGTCMHSITLPSASVNAEKTEGQLKAMYILWPNEEHSMQADDGCRPLTWRERLLLQLNNVCSIYSRRAVTNRGSAWTCQRPDMPRLVCADMHVRWVMKRAEWKCPDLSFFISSHTFKVHFVTSDARLQATTHDSLRVKNNNKRNRKHCRTQPDESLGLSLLLIHRYFTLRYALLRKYGV